MSESKGIGKNFRHGGVAGVSASSAAVYNTFRIWHKENRSN